MSRRLAVSGVLAVVACAHAPEGRPPQGGSALSLGACLPRSGDLDPVGPPAQAADEEALFAQINGGAALWVELGFSRAVFQEYRTGAGKRLSLDLVEMKSEAAAQALYDSKVESATEGTVGVGAASAFAGYYLVFRQGRFCVTVAGSDPSATSLGDLEPAAKEASAALVVCRGGAPPS